jgi:hypothetical protein
MHLIVVLNIINFNNDMRICSFGVENIYNKPRSEATDILTKVMKINSGINKNSQKEIIHKPETVMEQN